MAINIIDHDAAFCHLGDALDAVVRARRILRDTSASDKVQKSVIDTEHKIYAARSIINSAIREQKMESSP